MRVLADIITPNHPLSDWLQYLATPQFTAGPNRRSVSARLSGKPILRKISKMI